MVLAHDINQGQRTEDIQIYHDVTFNTILLKEQTLKGLKKAGFHKPSPVQLHGLPFGKCGFDLLLEAKSGTGKTVVFSVVALEKLNLKQGLQVVILTPTREIAVQICDVIKQIGAYYEGLKVEFAVGGFSVEEDIKKFKQNVHVVVASPGRLRHLIQQKHIDMSGVRLLVLDEADKLMKKSFQKEINYIYSVSPLEKQVIMSSATYSENSKTLINKYISNAQHICPDNSNVLLGITQIVALVNHNPYYPLITFKITELQKLLQKISFKQCLIFSSSQTRVIEICRILQSKGWPVAMLYGSQDQTERLKIFKDLQEYKYRILVTTDLAARGIDASNVDLVINFDLPYEYEWETYLHRIGRAGRFGSHGVAISIMSTQEQKQFKKMLVSVKDSIHLSYFWTGDKFDLDDLESENLEQISVELRDSAKLENKYYEAVNRLSYNSNKIISEDFCGSFENSKNLKIETFAELIKDYENSLSNIKNLADSNTFQHMKMQKIPVTEYSTLYQNIKGYDTILEETIKQFPKLNTFSDNAFDYKKEGSHTISLNTEILNQRNIANNMYGKYYAQNEEIKLFDTEGRNSQGTKYFNNIKNIIKENGKITKKRTDKRKAETNENMANISLANDKELLIGKNQSQNFATTNKYAKQQLVYYNGIGHIQILEHNSKTLQRREDNDLDIEIPTNQLVKLKQRNGKNVIKKSVKMPKNNLNCLHNKVCLEQNFNSGMNIQNMTVHDNFDLENFIDTEKCITVNKIIDYSENSKQRANNFSKNEKSNIENSSIKNNISFAEHEKLFANTADVLFDAGLPTSFASSKTKYDKADTKTDNNIINSYIFSSKKDKNNIDPKRVLRSKNKKIDYYYTTKDSENPDESKKSFDSLNKFDLNNYYVKWYNELQLKMKQIEYITYIKEIKKK